MAALHHLKRLITARDSPTEAAERNQAKSFGQDETILHLGCESIAGEVAARHVPAQFVIGPVDAISVEGRSAACRTEARIVGEDLSLAQTPVLIEPSFIRLKRIFAA